MLKSKLIFTHGIVAITILLAGSCSASEATNSTSPATTFADPPGTTATTLLPLNTEKLNTEASDTTTLNTSNTAPQFFEVEIYDLSSIDAINQLHSAGVKGEDICNDRHSLERESVPDYAERELGSPVPLITPGPSETYAIAAAAVAYKSYEAVIRAWENPEAEQLLCIARLVAQPRLRADWINLRYLLRNNKSVRGATLPFRIATAGIRSGEAIVVGCLNANANGTIYSEDGTSETTSSSVSDQSFLFESLLAWIGGRWRVQTLKDHHEINCADIDQLISKNHESFQSDIEKGFDDWILSSIDKNWNWTEKEINKWLNL